VLLGIQLGCFDFRLQDFHLLWCSFQLLCLISTVQCRCPTTPTTLVVGLGCSLFARRYWGNHFCFLFLRLLRCFSSPGWLALTYGFSQSCLGLPHSDTSGSMLASNSPERFVGYYVLLRLYVPRYPPLALCSLTFLLTLFSCMQFSRFFFFCQSFLSLQFFDHCFTVS
jgi:hypothetical protein